MSLSTLLAPGPGRRQAAPSPRLAAENQRLAARVRELEHLRASEQAAAAIRIADLQAALRHTVFVLGDEAFALQQEQTDHEATRNQLTAAVRANRANAEAETVQTDVTALRAAMADVLPVEPEPVPQYRPYRRVVAPAVRVMPLWAAPFATLNPGRVNLAGAA